jgi:hypothetical protein
MDSHLNVSADIKVKFLDKNAKYYLNRSTILFGASDSGKSTILLEMLYLLKDHVPNIFVFAPTADANNAFEGIVPAPLIFKDVSIEKLEEIYKHQQAATKIYNTVNNLTSLRKLFERVSDSKSMDAAKLAYNNANIIIQRKQNDPMIDFLEKRSSIAEVKVVRDEYLKKLYKSVIRCNKKRINNMNPNPMTKYIIKYLDFNPNCVVVLDDCGAILKKFQKEEVVKKIIFQGRHVFINIILTLQDDMYLDSSIKKNAFVNVFTTSRCAAAYFERNSSSFSKKEKEIADKIITAIFAPSAKKDYKKLVYIRDDSNPFRYTIADIYDKFRFGCPSLWKMCDNVSKEKNTCDFDNDPLLSSFKIDL